MPLSTKEVAPLTFDERFGDRRVVFREGEDGEITHFFLADVPVVAYERVPWRENPLLHELIEEPFELKDGHVTAPEKPGLGLTLRRDFVRSITVP